MEPGAQQPPSANSEIRALALALLDAEEAGGRDAQRRSRELRTRLHALHNGELMTELVVTAVTCIALDSDQTPRTVYEALFGLCPSDADWREMAERFKEDSDGWQ